VEEGFEGKLVLKHTLAKEEAATERATVAAAASSSAPVTVTWVAYTNRLDDKIRFQDVRLTMTRIRDTVVAANFEFLETLQTVPL
jgi:hypothetical protein